MSSTSRNGESPEVNGNGLPISADEWHQIAAFLKLSPREVQIAEMLILDVAETRIAAKLGISPHTVHTHTGRIFRKLSVRSRVQLANRIFAESRAK